MIEHDDSLLSVAAAAARLERHPATLQRWIRSGRIQAYKRLGRTLLRRADVDALAEPVALSRQAGGAATNKPVGDDGQQALDQGSRP
jgi:excisionase family DNA binding protein